MSRTAAFLCSLAIGTLCAGTVTAPLAQEDDNSRAVRIIDQPGGPSSPPPVPAAPAAIPPDLAPPPPAAVVPSPALPPVVATPPPAALRPAPAPPPAVAMPPPPPPALVPAPAPAVAMPPPPALVPAPAPATAMPPPAVLPPALPPAAAMPPPSRLSPPPPPPAVPATPPPFLPPAENGAGVALDIQPGPEVQVGGKVTFRVSAKRPGYLILVDVDAAGRVTQIFPNRGSLLRIGSRENLNLVKPGRAMTIPEPGNAYAGFEFVAAPPTGTAMVVAILSDRPVQMLDLPDVPTEVVGQPEALNYIADAARSLRIASASESRGLLEAKWSFDARLYVVR